MFEPIGSTVKALVTAHEDWKATYGETVTVYSEGLLFASACTTLNDAEVDAAMAVLPSGTSGGWTRSKEPFAGGQPNPCPCDASPESRRHILFEA